jgi:CubicO group peptidase (beta-lactamase class C family)
MRPWLAVLIIACGPLSATSAAAEPVWPIDGWDTASPESVGLDPGVLADGLLAMRADGLAIHSLTVVRHGRVALDAFFYPYERDSLHNTASVTKSVMTTLIAIAAAEGRLDLDRPMLSFFPDRTVAHRDGMKERVTVRHLAEMASGLRCFGDPDEPTLHEMVTTADWVQFALDLEVVAEPGSSFAYCSPGMHLLSAILERAIRQTTLDYAREKLFGPLGITDVIWPADPQGVTLGWSDVHLTPPDMAKIGYLWLQRGVWAGDQIVPAEWVASSSSLQMRTGESEDYGYGWWIMTGEDIPQFAAMGRGGQRISVFPTLGTVIVTTGGGLDPGEAFAHVGAALLDPAGPLPANPAAEKRLREAIAEIARPPEAHPVGSMPPAAELLTGRTYVFESNPLGIESVRLDFDGTAEAILILGIQGQSSPRVNVVGLDGVYRFSPGENALPVAARARWSDSSTLVMDYNAFASGDAIDLRIEVRGDGIAMEVKDRTYAAGTILFGHAAAD